MCQIRAYNYRAAAVILTDFDVLLAARGFKEDQFRTPRGFVSADFFEPEHFGVEVHGPGQIGDSVAGMKEAGDHEQMNQMLNLYFTVHAALAAATRLFVQAFAQIR